MPENHTTTRKFEKLRDHIPYYQTMKTHPTIRDRGGRTYRFGCHAAHISLTTRSQGGGGGCPTVAISAIAADETLRLFCVSGRGNSTREGGDLLSAAWANEGRRSSVSYAVHT